MCSFVFPFVPFSIAGRRGAEAGSPCHSQGVRQNAPVRTRRHPLAVGAGGGRTTGGSPVPRKRFYWRATSSLYLSCRAARKWGGLRSAVLGTVAGGVKSRKRFFGFAILRFWRENLNFYAARDLWRAARLQI